MRRVTIRLTDEEKQKLDKVVLATNLPYIRIVRQALALYYETKPFKIKKIPFKGNYHVNVISLFLDDYYYSELSSLAQ